MPQRQWEGMKYHIGLHDPWPVLQHCLQDIAMNKTHVIGARLIVIIHTEGGGVMKTCIHTASHTHKLVIDIKLGCMICMVKCTPINVICMQLICCACPPTLIPYTCIVTDLGLTIPLLLKQATCHHRQREGMKYHICLHDLWAVITSQCNE